jgi:hypothetical protein
MTVTELEKRAGRSRPSEAERKLAAKVRVRADKRRKVQTPAWILKLASKA